MLYVRDMKNIRDSSKIPKTTKKVKRLHEQANNGNSLWQKLEPTLPFPRKRTKFKSPYKSPALIQLSTKIQGSDIPSEKGRDIISKNVSKTSTVKIQPIDPFKFCEPFLSNPRKDQSSKNKPPPFEKSLKMKKVNREVLALIQKTAATIKMIRKLNEEWKKSQHEMSFLQSLEGQHRTHRKIKHS